MADETTKAAPEPAKAPVSEKSPATEPVPAPKTRIFVGAPTRPTTDGQ